MRISGFTFVRNGIVYDYPFRESICSVLPLVDEFIVNIPYSDDKTYEAVLEIGSPKIKIFQTEWNGDIPSGGKILSHHTNLALKKCTGDWCFYIQADEVIHENDHPKIKSAMENNLNDKKIDGLLFDYLHFYGSYNCVASSRTWYRNEVRIVRNNPDIVSFDDAQGFRFTSGGKLNVVSTGARVFHYGWVRPIESMRIKKIAMDRLWHGNKMDEENRNLEYSSTQYGLKEYNGTHPSVMKERIKKQDWQFVYNPRVSSYRELRYWFSDILERITGKRFFEYKGYNRVKD
ncbi:MAG: glycosyltransferase family 2 protein [Pseudomonadota bacterium]